MLATPFVLAIDLIDRAYCPANDGGVIGRFDTFSATLDELELLELRAAIKLKYPKRSLCKDGQTFQSYRAMGTPVESLT